MRISRYREFHCAAPAPGVRLFALRTDRYKTVSVRAFLCEPLRKLDATRNALLAYVLRAGSETHPTRRDIARALEELWGATAGVGVTRFGDVQAVTAGAEFPADRFLPKGARDLDGVLALLSGMLLRPALDPSRSALRADVMAQESSQLHNDLVAQRDDKPSWAAWLAAQRVYAGTPGAIHEQGSLEDLPRVTNRSLLLRHRLLLRNANVFLFVTGPVTPEHGLAALARHFSWRRKGGPRLPAPAPLKARARIQRAQVKEKSEQVHLISAWTGAPLYGRPGFAAALYADGILGGFSFSRMFKVVREEHGLAYAVSSAVQRNRGVLFTQAAVDPAKAGKAAKLIRAEFNRLAKDGFTREEFENCRDSLIEARRSAWDSPSARVRDCVLQAVMGFVQDTESQLCEIRAVRPAQVMAVLRKLRPHTEFRYG